MDVSQISPPFDPGQVAGGGPLDGTELALLLVRALHGGQHLLAFSVGVIGLVWLARNFGRAYWPWLGSSRGGAVLSLLAGQAAALANAVVTGQLGAEVLVRGLVTAFVASGGWSLIKAILPEPRSTPAPAPGLGGPLAGVLLVILLGAQGCAHPLRGPRHDGIGGTGTLAAPAPAPFALEDASAAEQARACRDYDTCFLVCATAAPILSTLGAAGAGLPALARELPDSTRTGLLITGAVAGALGAGAGVCSQACAARFADYCR